MADHRVELLAAADMIAGTYPRVAARLRQAAATPSDRSAIRGHVLRQIRREHFGDQSKTVAARNIAACWRIWVADPDHDALPGSLGAYFARLARLGCRPLKERRIFDLLDD
jgi:hypothetical protein